MAINWSSNYYIPNKMKDYLLVPSSDSKIIGVDCKAVSLSATWTSFMSFKKAEVLSFCKIGRKWKEILCKNYQQK